MENDACHLHHRCCGVNEKCHRIYLVEPFMYVLSIL